jgi:hypothetical protein
LVVKKGSKMRSRAPRRHAGAVVGHAQPHALPARRRLRASTPVAGHARRGPDGGQRLLRVDHQVQHHLADLVGVGLHLGQVRASCSSS